MFLNKFTLEMFFPSLTLKISLINLPKKMCFVLYKASWFTWNLCYQIYQENYTKSNLQSILILHI
jgi:hypothetical protein